MGHYTQEAIVMSMKSEKMETEKSVELKIRHLKVSANCQG